MEKGAHKNKYKEIERQIRHAKNKYGKGIELWAWQRKKEWVCGN